MTTTEKNLTVTHPTTGEVLDLTAMATDALAAGLEDLGELLRELGSFRQTIIDEIARRMDTLNTRTEVVGKYKLETNAPTEETYSVKTLRAELATLVEEKVLDPAITGRLITYPPPTIPAERVDKREVNKLKRHDDNRVLAALARARTVSPQRRTLTVHRVDQ